MKLSGIATSIVKTGKAITSSILPNNFFYSFNSVFFHYAFTVFLMIIVFYILHLQFFYTSISGVKGHFNDPWDFFRAFRKNFGPGFSRILGHGVLEKAQEQSGSEPGIL